MTDKLETFRPVIRDLIADVGSDAFLKLVSEELYDIAELSKSNSGPWGMIRLYEKQAALLEVASSLPMEIPAR